MPPRAIAAALFASTALVAPAYAQNLPVYATGTLTPGHALVLQQTGTPGASVTRDAGPAIAGNFTELGITNDGLPFCIRDKSQQHILCFGANALGGGAITYNAIGSGTALPFNFVLNGQIIPVPGAITGLPQVINNATLKATPTSFAAFLVRSSFTAAGDAPPQTYYASASPCSVGGGAGDDGDQVRSSDGLCWIAVPPSIGLDLRQWGIKFDNATNNSTAMLAAFNWGAKGNTIACPDQPLPALFTTNVDVTLTAGARLALVGNGGDGCQLEYTGGGGIGALTLRYPNIVSSVTLQGFALTTNQTGGPTGIILDQLATSSPNGFQNTSNVIQDVWIRGADFKTTGLQYFSTALRINGVSYISYNQVNISGPVLGIVPVVGTIGVDLQAPNAPGVFSVVHNFAGVNFQYMDKAINEGVNIQGLTIHGGSNFDVNNYGVYIGDFTGTGQVTVVGNQFNVQKAAVFGQPATLMFDDNYVIMQNANNATGLLLGPAIAGCTVTNNTFQTIGSSTGTQGINYSNQAPTPIPCTVTDNNFWASGSGNMDGNFYGPSSGFDETLYAHNHYIESGSGSLFPFSTLGMQYIGDQPQPFATLTGCVTATLAREAWITDSPSVTWGAGIGTGGGPDPAHLGCNNAANGWTVEGK